MTSPSPTQDASLPEAEYLSGEVLLEEESFSWYSPSKFYAIHIGDIVESRYQVLAKLGYGSVSTAWLCKDMREDKYVTLKVYMTGHRQALNEAKVMNHLNSTPSDHPGAKLVRTMLDTFEIEGEHGKHVCMVYQPLSLSLRDIRTIAGGQVPAEILKPMLYAMLLALEYLHTVAHVVHTDIQDGNIMLSIDDESIWDEALEGERQHPSPRKEVDGRTTYSSLEVDMPDDPGEPMICDFGDAQIGAGPFKIEVMPDLYRAPEIVLGIPWNEKIDIWAFGLMIWDLVQGKHLFNEKLPTREASAGTHLSKMIALMGPPPPDLAENAGVWDKFLDAEGCLNPGIKTFQGSLEDEDEIFEGDEKTAFLSFTRKMLRWRPEDRLSAKELLEDSWLRGDWYGAKT
ncbi:Serine/threonine-protein kinase SRPK [Fulvia fulva]|nr:Serine/threonine-protein kinase SRPK [Fulvia fulva]WPV34350.1 Serine/threonine-protein kinase SRPK [Fulvia fulva]